MRIEINAGGIGKLSILSFENSLAKSIEKTAAVIDSFAEIKEDTYDLNGGVGDCADAVDYIDSRIAEEKERLESELDFHREVNDFIALSIRVDREVANEIRQAKNEFYDMHPWARPVIPEEESWLEQLGKGLKSAAEFIADFAKEAIDSIIEGFADFVDRFKEQIAEVIKWFGWAITAAAGIIGLIALAHGFPLIIASLIVGLVTFAGEAIIGFSKEVAEHGSDLDSYDWETLIKTAAVEGIFEAIGFFIAGKLKLLPDASNFITNIKKLKTGSLNIKLSDMKSALMRKISKGMRVNLKELRIDITISVFENLSMDIFDLEEFDILDSLKEPFELWNDNDSVPGGLVTDKILPTFVGL